MAKFYDVIVVGSGIAGLSFALKVAEAGYRVAIITKKTSAESNTNYAQGGIAAVTSQTDDVEMHVADTLDAELATVGTTEGAAYGAAVLASVGAGWHAEVEAATDAWVTTTERTAPGETSEMYAQIHRRYRDLYPALKPIF